MKPLGKLENESSSLLGPFLNRQVIVKTVDRRVTVKGTLVHVDASLHGLLGNVFLEDENGRLLLIRGDRVAVVAVS